MKAMAWLKVGGGVLVGLAAIAAADTRRMEISADPPGTRHVIAARAAACRIVGETSASKGGCCAENKTTAPADQHSGCCRK